ncbi:MAG: hypothetical protein Q7S44_03985 [bacterium]|nr:hypothetical protein [bacterium]
MVVFITLNSSMAFAVGEYYLLKREFNKNLAKLVQTTQSPEELVNILKQQVLPAKGYTTTIPWKNLGKQLVDIGAIDKQKYVEIFTSSGNGKEEMKYLEGESMDKMMINEGNSRFMVNTLWALGLVNKSKVLDEGPMMQQGRDKVGNFASTGGWTLGSKGAMELYSSQEIIPLTSEQQDLVKKIAENVFRSCCGNSTAFPDCNHGMAALGYIEWAVYNGLSEKQIYKDLLSFNSFWFPQNYVEMAMYFEKQGTKWKDVDPKVALSLDYSSLQGAQRIKQAVQNVPGIQSQGGGCGA